MKSLIMSFLALIITASSEKDISQQISLLETPGRIERGEPAAPGQFPYQVGLLYTSVNNKVYKLRGGSLISSEWVLTDANSVHGESSVKVVLGGINWKKPELSFTVNSSNFIIYDDKYNTVDRNIALIKIPPVKFTKNIQKIDLEKPEQWPFKEVYITGWGRRSELGTGFHDILHFTHMYTIKNDECVLRFNISDGNICAKTAERGGIEFADKGCPMVSINEKKLMGVKLFGWKNYVGETISVFTRVSSYMDWITKHTGIE